MRLGIISDVHCNAPALERALSEMAGRVEEVLVAGDIVYEYRFSAEVVGRLRRLGPRAIVGNHDMVLLGPHGHRARSAPGVEEADVAYLAGLPTRVDTRIDGKRLTMVHGSPWHPYDDYVGPGSPLLARCGEVDADFLVMGHTHLPLVHRAGRTLVVNPGSIGESREPGARDTVTYAVLDTVTEEVEIVRFANPRMV